MAERRRPLLCRLGWHTSTFLDCAAFTSARCCNHCGEYLDPADAEALRRERRAWDQPRSTMFSVLAALGRNLDAGEEP